MDFINFFREDAGEILGVHFDGEKIFIARLNDKIEVEEFCFEIADNQTPAVEQLAQKIKLICNKNLWHNPKISLVLREGTAATFESDFKNIPAAEIASAVKIWAVAHVGQDARYTFIKSDSEIWMEALPALIVEEYISAFDKNSLQLCNLTEFPTILSDDARPPTSYNRAVFAADILKNKKPPNILPEKNSAWNTKKIALVAAVAFLIVLVGISAKLGHNYFTAVNSLETAQNRLKSQADTNLLKSESDAATAQIKRFDSLISAQNINPKKFNALIKIGRIYDAEIIPNKIKATDETLEIEGVAESSDAVKIYLNRLKNIVSPKVKLKNSTEDDGQIIFSISIIFS